MRDKQHSTSPKEQQTISGQFAAGRDIIINHIYNFKYLILSFFLITAVITAFSNRNDIQSYWNSKKKFHNKKEQQLDILILPFRADQDAERVTIDYQDQLNSRLEKLKDSLVIRLLSISELDCPSTTKEAKKIGKEKNADLVIWGSFEEHLGYKNPNVGKVQIQYALLKDFKIPNDSIEEGNEQGELREVSELKEGYLQRDIDYIVQWVKGLSAFYRFDIKAARGHFDNIINDSLFQNSQNNHALKNLSDIYFAFGDYNKSLELLLQIYYKGRQEINDIGEIENISIIGNIASKYQKLGDTECSLEYFEDALNQLEKISKKDKKYYLTKNVIYSDLGHLYFMLDDYKKQMEYARKSQSIEYFMLKEFGDSDTTLRNIITGHVNLANGLIYFDSTEAALREVQKADSVATGYLTSDIDPYFADIFYAYGQVYYRLGN